MTDAEEKGVEGGEGGKGRGHLDGE